MMEQTIKEQERMVQSRKEDLTTMNNQFNVNNQILSSLKEKSQRLRNELNRLNNEHKNMQDKIQMQNQEIKREINNIGDMTNQISNIMGNLPNSKEGVGFYPTQETPKKDFHMSNIRVIRPSNENSAVKREFPSQNNNFGQGMAPQERQTRINDGSGPNNESQMPGGMNRQARPQSIDPSRTHNLQPQSFGNINVQNQQRPNDDNFYGNSGMTESPNKGQNKPTNSGDGIDWGL